MLKALLATTVIAWATSAQASAVQCTVSSSESYPGPKELESFGGFAKAVLPERLKPVTYQLVFEFLSNGTVATSMWFDDDKELGANMGITAGHPMIFATTSLAYTLTALKDPSQPLKPHDDTFILSIDRQTGALHGTSTMYKKTSDETTVFTETGQCHPVTIPEPKL